MKKIFTYFAALTALFAVSCNRIELNDGNQAGRFTISLSAGDLETRADENQTTAEKTIDHFDYFFFSDAEGTDLLQSGRETGTTKTFDTTSDEYKDLAGKSYLYVIANYPTAIPEGTETLEQLLALPVGVSITEHPEAPFVMDSYDADNDNVLIELVPTKADEVRNQVVMMRRIAAKFVVNVTVAEYAQAAGGLYWKPTTNTKDFYMYMVNALDEATVSGEPLVCSDVEDETKFYTYNHTHNDMTGEDLEWVSAVSYAYPETFAAADQKALYFKVQMPWVHVNDVSLPATGSNIGAMGTHQFYYKVLLPGITEITRNSLYTLNLTLDKVGGTQEDYVVVTGTDLMVTNWLSPSGQYSGYYSARFLDTARDVYYIYGDDFIDVPVTSSHPISATVTSAKKYDFQNRGVEVNVNTTTSPYSITNNGKSSFRLTHVLDNVVSHQSTYDCSPITFTVDIKHEDNKQTHIKTVTIIQYPPVYIKQETSNGRAYINGTGNRENYDTDVSNNSRQDLGGLVSRSSINDSPTGSNVNPRQYTVYVSVLPSNSTAIIGDPRGPKGGVSNLGTTVSNNYRPTAENTQNVIAPAFKMASSYGKTSDLVYDRARERCAAYQENGYPAGRWRVPTVAEIEFVISLSEYNHIPDLYDVGRAGGNWSWSNNNRRYWCYWAGGMYAYGGVQYQSDSADDGGAGVAEPLTSSNLYDNSNARYRKYLTNRYYYYVNAVRCVYDVWYWGEEQDTDHMTSWSGYQTD